ncbi:MAG: aminotransferase class V-fold PLP-dependent enzyme [Rhodocyclaceae bacterium]|nr:aminotransferase class V-fold PLP-dependent enzyme [Rhodocyclaceae bacterium]
MSLPRPEIDADGLLEYSVVYTDRALNHMSRRFQAVMRDLSATLKSTYHAHAVAIVPGGGTYGMEAVARQFATGQRCLVLRHGWFSYRWSQIFAQGNIPSEEKVLMARPLTDAPRAPFAPPPLEEIVEEIARTKPTVVCAPHVETASGILLPDDYLTAIASATHRVGGLFVLDGVASGAVWVDMEKLGIDVLISAPQKGWSGPACAAFVLFSPAASERLSHGQSTSFALDLKKWREIMAAYEAGHHAYHATMPTDALLRVREAMKELEAFGLEAAREAQWRLGKKVRALLAEHGFASVAAPGFEAPGVVVSYTDDAEIQNGKKFAALGLQIAAGVPLMCGEGADFSTFRIGLFGLDKLADVDGTVSLLARALERLAQK